MAADAEKLLGLLGLARRAGRLAVGFSAVEQMVRRGEAPLVVVATDAGASQLGKIRRWDNLRGLVDDALTAAELARAMGRDKLVVVGVSDPGFIKGIQKLVVGGTGS
jgi:ribosomal protein L7Ae-like RNA K-turn-binding protein